ncbi:DUF6029 family protein [uncultured Bacteroides sp.]|uniref:DUF6029 family protein n=1 Tax=uncultured Bacteroides sp. TaxID=162156 RepID=UPI002609F6CF|nr:DUF6029 family protein [uncultured Bacteroides sp.]
MANYARNFMLVLAACSAVSVMAQDDDSTPKSKKGYLTGSFETNTIYYRDDSETGAQSPDDHFGSNNYLKLDYYQGKFSAGAQLEVYEPALMGYPTELEKSKITNYYVSWSDENFSVTGGTFYDQFGSGLLFRAWEDRSLGLNNALMGARFTYNYKNIVRFKAMWGMPRFGMEFSDTQVRGADISFGLSSLLDWKKTNLWIEASALNRYEEITAVEKEDGAKPYTNGFSGRVNFERNGFTVKGEYVDGGNKYMYDPQSEMQRKRANAQLIEASYNGNGLGVNLSARRLEWMDTDIISGNTSTSNMINYVPALCTQYTYLLTNLHPYTPQLGQYFGNFINSGEIGAQLDVFYNFRRGTTLGGKRGLKVHANFSTYYTLEKEGTAQFGNLLFRDFSFDFEKQFTKEFKLNFLYSRQERNPNYGTNKTTHVANIFVADMQYKFTPTFSTRLELQYLTSQEDDKDWMAGLLEVNFAPTWSIYCSDMYNNGDTKTHYYNVGVSYAKSRTRIALSYGRNKAGYVCSGGVCRIVPAYTGANLAITTSF